MSLEAKTQALATAFADLIAEIAGGSTGETKSAGGKAAGAKGKAAGKKAGTTVDQLAEKFGAFLSSGSAAEKKKAKQIVGAIVQHFDAERVSKIDPENFDEALTMLAAYQNDDDPLDLFDGDGDDDGGLM